MEPVPATPAEIDFGRFQVLPHRRELVAEGQPIKLGGRAFDVLMALIEARGAVIGKDALMARVWSDRIVEENNLQAQISALRAALGTERELIRTIPGRGYQFTGEIRILPANPDGRAGAAAAEPQIRPAADEPARADFRADWPGRRTARDPEPRRRASARHPDGPRRHWQDAPQPGSRTALAA
jgi:DNA-binding winged helix-turn-helix (wHTH) protein